MPIVSLRNVTKTFPGRGKKEAPLTAIDGVDLDINEGDIYGIIGYSGAGKSTLVRLINALELPSSGKITVNGATLSGAPESQLRKARLGIGMIFQQFNLFNSRSVWRNIEYPLQVAGIPVAERNARISDLLNFVGLADKAASFPNELSGGQKQRVGIARALATSPRILLADEATSALDPETTRDVLALLKRVNEEFGTTIVVITHEMEVIRSIAHKVAVMEEGRIVERGSVFDVFSAPQSSAAQKFVATVVRAVPEADELQVLRDRHPGKIVTLSFIDGSITQSTVFDEFSRHQVAFELIYGGINDIQGRTFGHLTLALTGEATAIERALAAVHNRVTVTEVN
ncbi:MAG TPA: methionine ABC transporter ATP-binding protein [Glaciihabitans sp.]|jgi:D-methionine transport system ATP-binding protein|nr:methionine ABC transporter ATP-binding protein [Glaciihabitans sp.]